MSRVLLSMNPVGRGDVLMDVTSMAALGGSSASLVNTTDDSTLGASCFVIVVLMVYCVVCVVSGLISKVSFDTL